MQVVESSKQKTVDSKTTFYIKRLKPNHMSFSYDKLSQTWHSITFNNRTSPQVTFVGWFTDITKRNELKRDFDDALNETSVHGCLLQINSNYTRATSQYPLIQHDYGKFLTNIPSKSNVKLLGKLYLNMIHSSRQK